MRTKRLALNPSLSGPERMVVTVVVGVVIAFEIWFFFFSGSPVDQRTGRAAVPMTNSTLSTLQMSH